MKTLIVITLLCVIGGSGFVIWSFFRGLKAHLDKRRSK